MRAIFSPGAPVQSAVTAKNTDSPRLAFYGVAGR